ncbi:hypothetical protein GGS23DRAFT_618109 [Durotheca rogersii]|uniref:uncharacterized protein n=1 Tax=Durotheca rogersii TaxID=419775 RepID=UPI00221F1EB8|nr:uncharacterized protein GGS23DRAFT_618109 [Durotheca rogersii]KAI5865123.1 hypothetical protein GGS23DRAFT_618109 [Durotheca rogersii]
MTSNEDLESTLDKWQESVSSVSNIRRIQHLTVASALGLSTIENIGFMYAAVQANQELALTLFERLDIRSPAHDTGGLLIGVNAARRDLRQETVSPSSSVGPFDFMLFAISALNGNSFSVVPGLTAAIQGALAIVTQRKFVNWRTHEVCYAHKNLPEASAGLRQ